jgi:uncharacterized protein YdhG (YjbR/CyaY superfamily)
MTTKRTYPVHRRANWFLDEKQRMPAKYMPFIWDGQHWLPDTSNIKTYYYMVKGVIRFQNNFHHNEKLKKIDRNLLEHLTQVMSPATNAVGCKDSDREDFIRFMKNHCSVAYKDKTVQQAFARLKKSVYLIKRKSTKELIVNPLYYTRGTLKEHKALIQSLLHEAAHPTIGNPVILKKMKFH